MKKRILNMILVILVVLSLSACNVELRARVDYISPNAYEQLRIEMIAEAEKTVIAVKTDSGHGSGIIFKVESVTETPGLYRYYAMTNYHVVEDAGEMKIYFGDTKDDIIVKDVAGNERYDIAVVRFETTRVLDVHTVSVFEDPDTYIQILKGQDVYAIGSPESLTRFGYVTQGIVALSSVTYNGIPGLGIMHDAELNPGNSGGALFNLNGDLIGINVAKISNISTSTEVIPAEGLNYSLSINALAPIVLGFEEEDFTAVIRKPKLGVSLQEISVFLENNDASLLPENPVGVVVVDFDFTRNAHLVLEVNDLIIEMNGIAITQITDLSDQLVGAEFGDMHTIKVMRNVEGTFVVLEYTIELS